MKRNTIKFIVTIMMMGALYGLCALLYMFTWQIAFGILGLFATAFVFRIFWDLAELVMEKIFGD